MQLLLQVTDAVAFAHGRLVLHRDLKPANVLVTAGGQVRLLDFGIAKLMAEDVAHETELTQAAGRRLTMDYASPEQIRGEPLGVTSDVYSLGVLAFELLAGARPYRLKRGTAAELEEAITAQDLPLASAAATSDAARHALRGDLDATLNRALKKAPAERYATVEALARDWRQYLAGERVLARPDTLAYRVSRFARRHRLPLAGGAVVVAAFVLALGFGATALVVMALLLGLAGALWQAARARTQARIAQAQTRVAEQASRRAQAVQGFLVNLFGTNAARQADPLRARATTARELLDLGAAQLNDALHDAPEARLELMATFSEMYLQLELEQEASAFDTQRIELLRRIGEPHDVRLAQALVHLATALNATGERARMLPLLQEAEAILDARGDHGSALRGELLARLAQCHVDRSVTQALGYVERAVAVLQAQPEPDAALIAAVQLHGAQGSQLIGDVAIAVHRYRGALEQLLRLRPPPHAELMQVRQKLAEVLQVAQQFDEALALTEQAATLGAQALGAEAPGVLMTHARWAFLLHQLGRRPQARAMLVDALERVCRLKDGQDSEYRPSVETVLGFTRFADGDVVTALPLMALEEVRRSYAGSMLLGSQLRVCGAFVGARGRHDEARAMLHESRELYRSGSGDAVRPWRYNRMALDLARLDLADNRPDAALQWMRTLVPHPAENFVPPHIIAVECATLSAHAHLQRGDPAAALHCAQAAAADAARVAKLGRQPDLEAEAVLALALARLAAGEPDAARAAAAQALALRDEFEPPTSVWRAKALAVHGRCLLACGHADDAAAAAAEAQALFDRQAPLSAFITSPLADLRRELATTGR